MEFCNFGLRYPSLDFLLLGVILCFHGFLLVQSKPPLENLSPPPPLFFVKQSRPVESGVNTPPPPSFFVTQSPPVQSGGNTTPPPPPSSQVNTPPSPPIPQAITPPPPPQSSVAILTPPPPPSPSPPPPPPSQPPPPIPKPPPPPPPRAVASPPHFNRNKSRRLRPPPPRIFKETEKSVLNTGKTVGLVFAGFAAMLQICVVAFLVFKRKQLLRMTHTY